MSEQGGANGPSIKFKYGGESYQMRPDNAEARLHSEVPEVDHFLIVQRGIAQRAFRTIFPMFDKWAQFMEENGYPVIHAAYPTDDTFMAYRRHYGEPDLHIPELTPRQDRRAQFEGYLMDNDIITIQHFMETRNETA